MERIVYDFCKYNYEKNLTMQGIDDLIRQIALKCNRRIQEMDTTYIALDDKLINLTTFDFEEQDIAKVALFKIPCKALDIGAPCPLWNKFLSEVLVTTKGNPDGSLVNLVQEVFGYYLLNELKPHAVFFLVGQGGNGKSVLLNILKSLIGEKYTTSQSIQSLTTDKFAPASLIGKKVNIVNEEESKYLRADKFKALVSGDQISAQRKFEGCFQFTPHTKYIFATNEMPTFEGVNEGLRRRMYIIPFNRIFKQEEMNWNLTDELKTELPAILGWALRGAQRLIKNNYRFSPSTTAELSRDEFITGTSSALHFIKENYVVDDQCTVRKDELYVEYSMWCKTNGKKALNAHNFNKDLKNNVPHIIEKVAWHDGHARRSFTLRKIDQNEYDKMYAEHEGVVVEQEIQFEEGTPMSIDDLLTNGSL